MPFCFIPQSRRQAATPKRRALKPQKALAPAGRLPASSNEIKAALFRLTDCAALVVEDWSPDAPAFALACTGENSRNQKSQCQNFMMHEDLSEQRLQQEFLVMHKLGGPPGYLKTL